MTNKKTKIVAVIPCYNTASHIAEVVTKTLLYVDQVIVVDDGSTDDTAKVARKAGAQVISHDRNIGYGAAIRTCFREAQRNYNDILITIDGDGQHNPDEIPQVLFPILKNEADLVIGSRFLDINSSIPTYRRLGIKAITLLYNLGSGVKVSDAQSGFRAYSRKILDAFTVTENGMGVSVELLIMARRKDFRIKEIPITCIYHEDSSTKNPVVHGLGVAFAVVKLRLKNKRLG